ncbi:MAG TPA: peptidoglycan-binding domain-containing protein [Paracoccaceae bacterium]|nr:peptidoglycan-binding domain-containing protein [Paracoccaceae bacterium]
MALMLALAACQTAAPPPGAGTGDLSRTLVPRPDATPPATPPGTCWAPEITPAVIETVTEQVQASAERRAPDGSLIAPATFRTETRQRILRDRAPVWIDTPCPEALTVEALATLQRALKARGLYLHPITGQMDAPTRAAIRAWQRPRGLDSDILSTAAARALGVLAAPLPG